MGACGHSLPPPTHYFPLRLSDSPSPLVRLSLRCVCLCLSGAVGGICCCILPPLHPSSCLCFVFVLLSFCVSFFPHPRFLVWIYRRAPCGARAAPRKFLILASTRATSAQLVSPLVSTLGVGPRFWEHINIDAKNVSSSMDMAAQAGRLRRLRRPSWSQKNIGRQLRRPKPCLQRQHLQMQMRQLLHQMVVLRLHFALFVVATTTNIVYCVLVHATDQQLQLCRETLSQFAPLLSWIHEQGEAPAVIPSRLRAVATSHFPLWKAVMKSAPRHPMRLIKSAVASAYSSAHGGIDKSTWGVRQLSSEKLKLSTTQKLVVRGLYQIAFNAVTFVKLMRAAEGAEWDGVKKFRKRMRAAGCVKELGPRLAVGLLRHSVELRADAAQATAARPDISPAGSPSAQTGVDPFANITPPRRNRFKWFERGIGKQLRFSDRHLHGRVPVSTQKSCILCRKGTWSKCTRCRIPLCAKKRQGQDSCFIRFHQPETSDSHVCTEIS